MGIVHFSHEIINVMYLINIFYVFQWGSPFFNKFLVT